MMGAHKGPQSCNHLGVSPTFLGYPTEILHDPGYLLPWEIWYYGIFRPCRIFSINSSFDYCMVFSGEPPVRSNLRARRGPGEAAGVCPESCSSDSSCMACLLQFRKLRATEPPRQGRDWEILGSRVWGSGKSDPRSWVPLSGQNPLKNRPLD